MTPISPAAAGDRSVGDRAGDDQVRDDLLDELLERTETLEASTTALKVAVVELAFAFFGVALMLSRSRPEPDHDHSWLQSQIDRVDASHHTHIEWLHKETPR